MNRNVFEIKFFELVVSPLDINNWKDLGIPVVLINPNLLVNGEPEDFLNSETTINQAETLISQWVYILMITGCIVVVLLLVVFAWNYVKTKKYQT